MKVDVYIEWSPELRKWEWSIATNEGKRDWGWAYTLWGAKRDARDAVVNFKIRMDQDRRNAERSIHWEVEL